MFVLSSNKNMLVAFACAQDSLFTRVFDLGHLGQFELLESEEAERMFRPIGEQDILTGYAIDEVGAVSQVEVVLAML